MGQEQTKSPPRGLRWGFWLVLFWPAMISLAAPVAARWVSPHNVLGWVFFVNVVIALPLNFLCSNWAAKQIIRLHDARGASSPWMFLWGPLFFFLNVALVFGGCAAIEQFAHATQ